MLKCTFNLPLLPLRARGQQECADGGAPEDLWSEVRQLLSVLDLPSLSAVEFTEYVMPSGVLTDKENRAMLHSITKVSKMGREWNDMLIVINDY